MAYRNFSLDDLEQKFGVKNQIISFFADDTHKINSLLLLLRYNNNEKKVDVKIDLDGRIKFAECTCGFHKRNKLRQGPCQHIMAAAIWVGKN